MDSRSRSLLKALSWRLCGFATTCVVAYLITGEPLFSATMGLLDTLAKLGLYYGHERLWEKVEFGRRREPEYEI